MDKGELALDLLPQAWRDSIRPDRMLLAEEIRLRIGRAPTLLSAGEEIPLCPQTVRERDLFRILEKATGASMHAAEASFREGFVHYRGLRIGVCGAAQSRDGEISVFSRVSSLAIRIPREIRGICDGEIRKILREGYRNTLVLGPPGSGKTTLLRELIRRFSESGIRICVSDDRNELAASDAEGNAYDLGRCTDVLTGVSKSIGVMMLLRGMNPQIIAVDEISREQDLDAMEQIAGCGVGILASAHGGSPEDLMRRKTYRRLREEQIFTHVLYVTAENGKRTYRMESLST